MRVTLAGFLFAFSAWTLCAQLPTYEPPRDWKTAEGQPFKASVVSFDGKVVAFRMPNGSRAESPLEKLSAEDQAYLAEWQKKQPIKFVMPDVVGVDTANVKVEVVKEDERNDEFIYRTQHFEFISQGKFTQGLLKEVARNFEATYELLKALPWDIQPAPEEGDYFRAKLMRTQQDYAEAGGMANSGGVYMRHQKVFMVPFRSIGLKAVGKSYAKDSDFTTETLVHELTHQMMHAWLPYLPQWVIEGTAEYTAMLPLSIGKFRVSSAKSGLKDYISYLKKVQGSAPEPYPLDELFHMTNQTWNKTLETEPRMAGRLYFTSYLLVYYFMHLDGKGDGQLFVRYFREMAEFRKQVEDFQKEVEAFKKLPGVEVNEKEGTYRWPSTLKAPVVPAILASEDALNQFQKKSLEILLDGRTEDELMKQIRSAYMKLGIRL